MGRHLVVLKRVAWVRKFKISPLEEENTVSSETTGQSITFHLFPLITSFVVFSVCFGSLSCCIMKLPCSSKCFTFWICCVATVISYIISKGKWACCRAVMQAQSMTLSPPCFIDKLMYDCMFRIMSRYALPPHWSFHHFGKHSKTFVAPIWPSSSYCWWVFCYGFNILAFLIWMVDCYTFL